MIIGICYWALKTTVLAISYDGKLLKDILKKKESQFGIHSNSIWSIHSDSTNRIWLGFTIKV